VHLCAKTRIQVSLEYPRETYDVNVNGTVEICELAREQGSKLIYAGSSSYYGGSNKNPYACSKHLGEEVVKTYGESYGLNYIICRFFNVYGERNVQDLRMGNVLGIFQKQFLENKPLTITGDGKQSRDFTYVKDICTGLIKCAESKHNRKIVNLGRGQPISVIELANMFKNNVRKEVKFEFIPERAGEQYTSCADLYDTITLLKWQPTSNLKDYVKKWLLLHNKYGFEYVGTTCPNCLEGTLHWEDSGYNCSNKECTYYDSYVCEDYDLETKKLYLEI
jgi:UDP-glucose 4-epimerase